MVHASVSDEDATKMFPQHVVKEVPLSAEIFASRTFICKFRKKLDLAHI